MRLSGITPESLVDGPGLRYVIFTQGCHHLCPNCHNPASWDIDGGKDFSVKEIIRMIKKQKKNIQGVTFSGGEPFLQAEELAQAAHAVRQIGLDVATYTGFTYEELIEKGKNDINITILLCETDLLIDGKYINERRTTSLPFRGSSNQRIIDVAKTRENGKITLSNIS